MAEGLRNKITELGFGNFLKFNMDGIDDRAFAMFLMNRIKDDPLHIEFRGKMLLITPQVVHNVFGIPIGGTVQLPSYTYKEKKQSVLELRRLCDENDMKDIFESNRKGGDKKKPYEDLKKNAILRWVIEHFVLDCQVFLYDCVQCLAITHKLTTNIRQ